MALQATKNPSTPHGKKKADSLSTIKSKYWNNDGTPGKVHSDLPCLKKRRTETRSTSREPGQVRLQSLPAGSTTTAAKKQQYKRKFENVFDFGPKTVPDIKEEPQDETVIARPATMTQHFATFKSGQPATALKTTSPAPKRDEPEPAGSSNEAMGNLSERSVAITTLAYVEDGAVTEAVTSLVLRWARELGQGDVYDAAFIRGILDDLDLHRIDSDRRAVVTEMLARPLQKQLETLRSSSESLLSCLASINTPQPSSPAARNSRRTE